MKKASSQKKKQPSSTRQKYLANRASVRDSILHLLKQGKTVKEAMAATGASRALVYAVQAKLRAESQDVTTKKDLPFYALKSADPWKSTAQDQPLFKMNCVGCRQVMWTDSKKNDLCESCMYQAMTEAAEASIVREQPRFSNPFHDNIDVRETNALKGKLI